MIESTLKFVRYAKAGGLHQHVSSHAPRAVFRLTISRVILVLLCCQVCSGQSVDRRVASAKTAMVAGKYREAAADYRKLLREQPDSPQFLTGLGIALHSEGNSSEAIIQFEHSLRELESPVTLTMLGVDYCRVGYADRAKDILNRAKKYFADTDLLKGLGPCYLDAGEPLDAILVYQTLLNRSAAPEDENAVNLARAYLKAANYFVTRLQHVPESRNYVDAIRKAQAGSSPDARGAFSEALAQAPFLRPIHSVEQLADLLPKHKDSAPLLYLLGVVCGEQAITTVTTVEQKFPQSASVRRLRAEVFASQGAIEEARNEYEAVLKSSAPSPGLYHDAAMFYRRLGDWNQALAMFTMEQSVAPDDERAFVGISGCLLQLGRYESDEQMLRPVVQRPTPPEWALIDFAAAEQYLSKPASAVTILNTAEKRDPDNPLLHYHLMTLYRKLGKYELAGREARVFQELRQAHQTPAAAASIH